MVTTHNETGLATQLRVTRYHIAPTRFQNSHRFDHVRECARAEPAHLAQHVIGQRVVRGNCIGQTTSFSKTRDRRYMFKHVFGGTERL